MASSFPSTTTGPGTGVGRGRRVENSAKTMVSDQISQAVLSTSNLIHIMLQSSPSQDNLVKLPKNLLEKASTINNTKQALDEMPWVISSLEAHMDHVLQSVPHLETVTRLLSNLENSQLKPLTNAQLSLQTEEPKPDTSTPP